MKRQVTVLVAAVAAAVFLAAVAVVFQREPVSREGARADPPPRIDTSAEKRAEMPPGAATADDQQIDEDLAAFADSMIELPESDAKVEAVLKQIARERYAERMRAADMDKHAKWDLPPEEIEKQTTCELLAYFLGKTPCAVVFTTHNDPHDGVARVKSSLRVLGAAIEREDIADAVLGVHGNISAVLDDPEKVAAVLGMDGKPGAPSLFLMSLDIILTYPEVIEKTAGREREIVALLADRDEEFKQSMARMGEAAQCGLPSREATMKIAARFVERTAPAALESWREQHRVTASPAEDEEEYRRQKSAQIDEFYRFALGL